MIVTALRFCSVFQKQGLSATALSAVRKTICKNHLLGSLLQIHSFTLVKHQKCCTGLTVGDVMRMKIIPVQLL